MENKLMKLRKFNLIMGGFHLVQAVIMLFLATNVIQKIGEFQPTIIQYFQTFNVETSTLEVTSKELFDLPFGNIPGGVMNCYDVYPVRCNYFVYDAIVTFNQFPNFFLLHFGDYPTRLTMGF